MPGREGRYRPTETGDRWIRCGNSRRERLVTPRLDAQFDLPGGFAADHKHQSLMRMATWATEKAKIELSSKDEAVASASESELATRDESGREIYLDVPIGRPQLDSLIAEELTNSIREARETIEKAGVRPEDIERIVFVGGPTIYAPLREKVAFELGIAPSTEVNAMTAVAEGAAVFAESIDWSSRAEDERAHEVRSAPEGG
jgi:molecular chaperone DnaK